MCGQNSKQAVKAAVWGSGGSWRTAVVRGECPFNPNTIKLPPPSPSVLPPQNPVGLVHNSFNIWTELLHWRSPCVSEQRIFTFFAKRHIPHLWASDIHTCPRNVCYASLVAGRKCTVSITFLLSASPSLHLYISHVCVVTGLCEECIKSWSQRKPESSGMWPQVKNTKQEKAVMRASRAANYYI